MDDVLNSGIVNNDSVNSDNNVNNKESNTTHNEGIDLINKYWSDDGHFESHNDKKDDI